MISFAIEQNHEIKEAFGYEIPFTEATRHSIAQYARAKYGPGAIVRNLSNEELANVTSPDRDSPGTKKQTSISFAS